MDTLIILLYYATLFAGLFIAALLVALATIPGLWQEIKNDWRQK